MADGKQSWSGVSMLTDSAVLNTMARQKHMRWTALKQHFQHIALISQPAN